MTVPSYNDIRDAARRIRGVAHRTPLHTSSTLDRMTGCRVVLKCENFQRMGAFKFRGAYNTVASLNDEQKRRGVIAHSSGNHAQAVALAARIQGLSALIVMPRGSVPAKRRATEETYGAEVVECENTLESRESTTRALIERTGRTLIHPYDEPRVIAGAGTAALELLEDGGKLDALIAPVGGGGLMSGSCIAAAGMAPETRLFGAEPEGADDARSSMEAGRLQKNERVQTVADGLRTNLSERTFAIIRAHVETILTVSDEAIVRAMRFLWERLKLVVEPSGAVGVAALMEHAADLRGAKVGVILSGGNVDLAGFFERF